MDPDFGYQVSGIDHVLVVQLVVLVEVVRHPKLQIRISGIMDPDFGKWFRGGLVFKAYRLVYHSTIGWRVMKKQRRSIFQVSGYPS